VQKHGRRAFFYAEAEKKAKKTAAKRQNPTDTHYILWLKKLPTTIFIFLKKRLENV